MVKRTVSLGRFIGIFIFVGIFSHAHAQDRTIDLTLSYKTVNFTGQPVRAIAINDQIPAPTLHLKEGDHVTIHVHNHIDQGTSIHWHGLIIPWKMDGVEGITQKAIPPGGTFNYEFSLHQHGTYWYHSHSQFQEQQGVYGGIVIDPLVEKKHFSKDYTIVLSDWNNTHPNQVYSNLKKEGDFYAIHFPMQPSLKQFFQDYHSAKTPQAKKNILTSYKMMQKMRMGIYDISDIAYDAYLLNGHTKLSPWTKNVKVGDVVRLRFIGAGASTFYRVKIPGTTMLMAGADGNDIKPYPVKSFSIAPGETFDVLVKITKNHPYVIYAESADGLGAAMGVLKTQSNQMVNYKNVTPFPKPKPIMMMGHVMHQKNGSNQSDMSTKKAMHHSPKYPTQEKGIHNQHSNHDKMREKLIEPSAQPLSSKTKYDHMRSLMKTNDPSTPVQIINMKLGGYMNRYIWFLNDTPFYNAKPITIKHGQRYRIIFTNETMMKHPMHIHGHWFILRNGHGAYDPKLHTIVVPPGATVVADFDANETGQWFFHCHNLMHMKAGMANIFRYVETPKKEFSSLSGHKKADWFNTKQLDLSIDPLDNSYEGTLNVLMGTDFHKLQLRSKDIDFEDGRLTHANVDIFYWRMINQFWAIEGGINYVYRPSSSPYLQPGVGLEGLMPYFIEADLRAYLHKGNAKFDIELSRNTQFTHKFFLKLSIDSILATKTNVMDEIGSGLNSLKWSIQPLYQVGPHLAWYIQYQRTNYYGRLRNIIASEGRPTFENTYSVGVSLLF